MRWQSLGSTKPEREKGGPMFALTACIATETNAAGAADAAGSSHRAPKSKIAIAVDRRGESWHD